MGVGKLCFPLFLSIWTSSRELNHDRSMSMRPKKLEQLCQKFGVVVLYSFGSRAETARDWLEGGLKNFPPGSSDLDMGVKGIPQEEWSVIKKVQFARALEDLYGCSRVDLVFLKEADPFLAAEIIRGERFYVRDEYEADEYELYVLHRAGDMAPLERERMALVLGEPI